MAVLFIKLKHKTVVTLHNIVILKYNDKLTQ